MTRWHRKETLNVRLRSGQIVRQAFTRRKVRVARPCSECRHELVAGSLFWRRGHRDLHIECFEHLQRHQPPIATNRGRKPVLNDEAKKRIDALAANKTDINYAEIARKTGQSRRTVRRYLTNQYEY